MTFYLRPSVVPEACGLLEKLEFPSINLENRCSSIGSRYDQEIGESEPAHKRHVKQNDPQSAAGEVKDESQVDPAGDRLRCRSVARGIIGNLIIAVMAFINAQPTPPLHF